LCYSRLSLFATAENDSKPRDLLSEKSRTQSWYAMQQSYPDQLCSLFVVCFHLFQPTTVSIGVGIRGGERKAVTSGPPFFGDSAGTIWEFRTWLLPGFFQSSTKFSLKWPNKLSQFDHNVQNSRVVNTVSASFDTIARKTTERSQRKKQVFSRFCWKTYKLLQSYILIRSETSHMLFRIKQQLFANVPNGAPQLYWGTFLRVCFRPLNSNM